MKLAAFTATLLLATAIVAAESEPPVVTPGAGTYLYRICDGTNWIVNGQVFSATVPAFSDT